MSTLKSRGVAVLAALAMAFTADCAARAEPRVGQLEGDAVRSLLWVGNSFFLYNNGMYRVVGGFSNAGGGRLSSVMATITSSGIDWHDVDAYLRSDSKVGSYSFIRGNEIRFNKPGVRRYDTMIVMDCSQCPIHPELKKVFREYAKKDVEIARKYGVRPVLFMSWAYKDMPEMTAQLEEAYTTVGNENDVLVIPAGLAYARAVKERPDLDFYQPDKRHPSMLGTYVAGATTYAALTGKSPVGSSYTGGLDAKVAAWLQTVAWETVNEYYASAKAKQKQPAN